MARDDGSNSGAHGRGAGSGPRNGRQGSSSNPNSNPSGRRSSSGINGNGLIRPPLVIDDDDAPRRPSGPRSRAGDPRSGGNGPRSQYGQNGQSPSHPNTVGSMYAARKSRVEHDDPPSRPRNPRRSMGQMARDLSRSMSRSLQSIGRAVRDAGRYEPPQRGESQRYPSLPPELAAEMAEAEGSQPYRRSRARLLARKWRLGRSRPRGMGYTIVAAVVAVLLAVVLGVGGAGTAYGVNYYNSHKAQIQAIANLSNTGSTQILDRNGQTLYVARSDDNGINIYEHLDVINMKVQQSTIETEDHTFYSNMGVDLYRTIGAAVADARSGNNSQGGSTITQQLVKNIVAKDGSKSYVRKLNEAILAYGVYLNYTKAQVLEMYLNTIDYGDQNTGIEAAARNYFGLQPKPDPTDPTGKRQIMANQQLDWAQAALLAGIPNAPSLYLPIQWSCNKAPCDSSKWDNPCLGDPRAAACDPNPKFDYTVGTGSGHEWLVWRRAQVVLDSLLRYGEMSQKEHDDAKQEIFDMLTNETIYHWAGVKGQNQSANVGDAQNLAPHFVKFVLDELVRDFGVTQPEHAGLKVWTTLDLNLNSYAQQRVHYYVAENNFIRWPQYCGRLGCNHPSLASAWNAHNGAVVAIDPHTGDILSMVGSVDFNDTNKQVAGQVNLATATRSMGSSTKAIVYATAFQKGWNPATMMEDQPVCYPVGALIDDPGQPDDKQPVIDGDAPGCAGWYVPHNFEQESFAGNGPIRMMLANSLNIPATEAQYFAGGVPATSQDFLAMASRMGITSLTASRIGPSTALGTQEIPLLELTSAFGTFADQGVHMPYRSILRIEENDGTLLYQAPPPVGGPAMSPQTAYMMTSVLTDNQARTAGFNSQSPLYFPDFPIASKTGTSQGVKGPRDIVTMGYSPFLAVGVWVGNSDNSDMTAGIIGIAGAGYIFADIMQWAHDNYKWPNTPFPIPPKLARGQFNCVTGLAPYANQGVVPCQFQPYFPSRYNETLNIYYAWNNQRVNEDWYIEGQAPLQS
jgi:membrane peptidoglycan carboxypeptidase